MQLRIGALGLTGLLLCTALASGCQFYFGGGGDDGGQDGPCLENGAGDNAIRPVGQLRNPYTA